MTLRECLIEALILTPTRDEFTDAYGEAETMVERARKLVIRATMGFGSAGATKEQLVFGWIPNAVRQQLNTFGQGCLKTWQQLASDSRAFW